MSQSEFTLNYETQDVEVDLSHPVAFPLSIYFEFHLVEMAKPSIRELRLARRPFLQAQEVEILEEDAENVGTLYECLHRKVIGFPLHNKFFIFTDTQEWNGFIWLENYVKYMCIHKTSSIVAIFNDTYFNRAIKLRNQFTIPPEMIDFLRRTEAPASQVQRVRREMQSEIANTRRRIMESAESEENVDVGRRMPLAQQLTIDINDPYITLIPINPEFKGLFIALNSVLSAMNLHLVPRGRSLEVDEDLVREIVTSIIEAHVPNEEEDIEQEDEEEDGNETDTSSNSEYPTSGQTFSFEASLDDLA